jgi:hypothetical protein
MKAAPLALNRYLAHSDISEATSFDQVNLRLLLGSRITSQVRQVLKAYCLSFAVKDSFTVDVQVLD